jgi:hypothetical protein
VGVVELAAQVLRYAAVRADVTVPAPSPNQLPGSAALSNLVAGVEYLALLGLVAAMAWFGLTWAIAHQTNNPYQVQSGKEGFLRTVGGAILVGASTGLINYFWHIGGQLR